MKLHRVVIHYIACRRIRTRGNRYRTREESDQVRLVVQAQDVATATRLARSWFEVELAKPTMGIRFGTGTRDATSAWIAEDTVRWPAIEVYEEDGDVMVLS